MASVDAAGFLTCAEVNNPRELSPSTGYEGVASFVVSGDGENLSCFLAFITEAKKHSYSDTIAFIGLVSVGMVSVGETYPVLAAASLLLVVVTVNHFSVSLPRDKVGSLVDMRIKVVVWGGDGVNAIFFAVVSWWCFDYPE